MPRTKQAPSIGGAKATLAAPTPRIAINPNGYTDASGTMIAPPLTSTPFMVTGRLAPSGLSGSVDVQIFLSGVLVGTWTGGAADLWGVLVTYDTGNPAPQQHQVRAVYNPVAGVIATDTTTVDIQE